MNSKKAGELIAIVFALMLLILIGAGVVKAIMWMFS